MDAEDVVRERDIGGAGEASGCVSVNAPGTVLFVTRTSPVFLAFKSSDWPVCSAIGELCARREGNFGMLSFTRLIVARACLYACRSARQTPDMDWTAERTKMARVWKEAEKDDWCLTG